MNRRKFFGAIAAGLSSLAIFPRKSESSQSEEGLSHEQMAQVILKHQKIVHLSGNAGCFGKSRSWNADGEVGKWYDSLFGEDIFCDYTDEHSRQTKSVAGCVVEVRVCSHSNRPSIECLFDISNPLLKIIRLHDTPSRHFARFGERWMEL